MRRHTQIVSIIEFIPQTVLNLMVIISTISTIYQSRVSCKPVFVFILNQAVADFALAIVFVVVVNLRYEAGGDLHNIERFVMSGCHTWTDMTCRGQQRSAEVRSVQVTVVVSPEVLKGSTLKPR